MKQLVKVLASLTIAALPFTASAQSSDVPGNSSDSSSDNVPGRPSDSTDSSGTQMGYPDLHRNNRAVAFGSLQIAKAGSDVNTWQAVDAYDWCQGSIEAPDPIPADHLGRRAKDSSDETPGSLDSCWDVMATTNYQLFVCPDGSPFILRSGMGVSLIDRNEGEVYSWSEVMICDEGGLGLRKNDHVSGLDKSRPLDLKHLKRQSL